MINQLTNTAALRPKELEAVYAISKVVAESVNIDSSLKEIITLARPVFIFDNAVLYIQPEDKPGEDNALEPAFARAIGRGRSSQEDLVWGEVAAKEAFQTSSNYLNHSESKSNDDRLHQRYYFGLPLVVSGKTIGALVFIRFGGPEFTDDQINLGEFIAAHVSQVLEHQRLIERIANLEAERRLAQMQEDFIAAVSHELNTPLGFIKGYTTTLLRDDTDWDYDTNRNFLKIIDEEADRLSELIDDLLDSSRLQSGVLKMNFQSLDPTTLIDDVVPRLMARYRDLDIKVIIEPTELELYADPTRISQVLENIIANAAKYAPGSQVTLTFSRFKDQVHIAVEDFGPGIPKKHLKNLFNRFYRAPESSAGVRGSGLGLFICEKIIIAHDGKIAVDSKKGEGTTFNIYLPLNRVPKISANQGEK